MGVYNFRAIEPKWQQYWKENRTFVAEKNPQKPDQYKGKYYVMDMFPYPSGAGLHVGHPLGYIATDIITRYKRIQGYNVLHPMGFDAFGLPAEQYAIKTGIHPAETTRKNIARYIEQMDMMGFHYDPDTQVATSDPSFYKWTQWIFVKMFEHWYDKRQEKARPITALREIFVKEGNVNVQAATTQDDVFTEAEWKEMSAKAQADIIMNYRLAYADYATVNWCPALGTVLANEEVKEGKSERGGFPVERRQMKQWMLRITAYSDRLLEGLKTIEWSDAIKSMQTNWIGRSEGASIVYAVEGVSDTLEVFTTRPDTIYGNTFMVVAPEHHIVKQITTPEQKEEVETYVEWATNRSERDRMSDTTKTGVWTGGYAIHPLTGNKLPIWISDYVVITYGTGAIMAVPAHDTRDYEMAKKFGLEIIPVIEGGNVEEEAFTSKDAPMINSDFLNGLPAYEAGTRVTEVFEERGIGKGKVTYRQRDVTWSRQRYWGEPTPIVYDAEGIAHAVDTSELPIVLPEIDEYKPSPDGQPPLGRSETFAHPTPEVTRDLNTMPGWAGSSWYFLRYVDPTNAEVFASKESLDYWLPIDLYVGGTEHAVGHLLYSRFWHKFLKDLDLVSTEEPFQKLVNQGMIQHESRKIYRHKETNEYVSADVIAEDEREQYALIPTDIQLVNNGIMDVEGYKTWTKEADATFVTNDQGEFHTFAMIEKMSKSKYNTVDPEVICKEYGADTLRLYEMFLGPIEDSKPWNTDGISGVFSFLKRTWNLFTDDGNALSITDEAATKEELKALHTAIKQTSDAIDRLAFNTAVPAFMVLTKELQRMKCNKRAILEPYVIMLSPFAPHIAEELWQMMGHEETILKATYPAFNAEYLVEDTIEYPVQINGKVRAKISVAADADKQAVEEIALADDKVKEWLNGKDPRKVIVVPGRIVNVVV
ncbi:MAG: leucine--tRNA ligase [Bacteroidota bacterium]